jgi:hypothetical protein
MRLWPVSFDDQAIIAVGLDVKVALARQPDHLHRQFMRDALVEEHASVRRPDLRALVANDRAVQPKPLRPRHRAGKGTPGAHDHRDPGVDDPVQRLDIARVEAQLEIEDGPVEVKAK